MEGEPEIESSLTIFPAQRGQHLSSLLMREEEKVEGVSFHIYIYIYIYIYIFMYTHTKQSYRNTWKTGTLIYILHTQMHTVVNKFFKSYKMPMDSSIKMSKTKVFT